MPRLPLPDSGRAHHWWKGRAVQILALLLLALPVAVTTLPPLTDVLGHLGRYHIQLTLADSPALQRNWAFHWSLIGNLGVDLLIIPLSALFGLERAVWLVALILPPLFGWGLIRIARAHRGAVTPLTLFALPLALAYPYQFGFINFWLGLALALHLYASWVRRPDDDGWRTTLLFALGAALIWVVHLYGWAIFCILFGSHELARQGRALWQAPVAALRGLTIRLVPVALPFVVMAIQQAGAPPTLTSGFFRWDAKWSYLTMVLRDQNEWLDKGSLALMALAGLVGWALARGRMNASLAVALVIFLLLQIILPIQLTGSAYADARLWPITIALALMAVEWRGDGRAGTFMASAGLILLAARCVVGASGFAAYDRAYAHHLRALDHVEPGKRIAVVVALHCPDPWRKARIDHLSSLAIVRRDAFTNGQWAIPGGQLLTPLGAPGTGFDRDPSQFLSHWTICSPTPEAQLPARFARIPKDRFDYLWLFDFDTRALQPLPGTRILYRDDATALYAIGSPATGSD